MPDPLDESGQTMHAFLDQVIEHAPAVESVGEAERLTRGVLATLAQAVASGQLTGLAPGLPPELRSEFDGHREQAEAMDFAGFIDRVGGQVRSTDPDVVEQQSRAVLSTLAAWAPPQQAADTRDQLPPKISALFAPAP